MQTTQAPMLASLLNVQKFLDDHAANLGDVATGPARQRLDGIVAELTVHVADQSGGYFAAQGFTRKQRALRAAPHSRCRRCNDEKWSDATGHPSQLRHRHCRRHSPIL